MEDLAVQTLLDVNDDEHLVGILEGSKLSASILIDIAKRLTNTN